MSLKGISSFINELCEGEEPVDAEGCPPSGSEPEESTYENVTISTQIEMVNKASQILTWVWARLNGGADLNPSVATASQKLSNIEEILGLVETSLQELDSFRTLIMKNGVDQSKPLKEMVEDLLKLVKDKELREKSLEEELANLKTIGIPNQLADSRKVISEHKKREKSLLAEISKLKKTAKFWEDQSKSKSGFVSHFKYSFGEEVTRRLEAEAYLQKLLENLSSKALWPSSAPAASRPPSRPVSQRPPVVPGGASEMKLISDDDGMRLVPHDYQRPSRLAIVASTSTASSVPVPPPPTSPTTRYNLRQKPQISFNTSRQWLRKHPVTSGASSGETPQAKKKSEGSNPRPTPGPENGEEVDDDTIPDPEPLDLGNSSQTPKRGRTAPQAGPSSSATVASNNVGKKERFECDICKKLLSGTRSVERHNKIVHMKLTGKLGCPYCKKRFYQRSNYVMHVRIHTGKMPYRCHICKRGFRSKHGHKSHSVVHDKKRKREFKCHLCPKTCFTDAELQRHIIIHSPEKPHKCGACKKGFKTPGELKKHMVVHSNKRPHKCLICGRGFKRPGELTLHKRMHDNVRPFDCKLCNKRFYRSGHLKSHLFTHTGERPYKCRFCDRTFAQASNWRRHQMQQHKEQYEAFEEAERSKVDMGEKNSLVEGLSGN